jgi:hypothetical protein
VSATADGKSVHSVFVIFDESTNGIHWSTYTIIKVFIFVNMASPMLART